LPFVHNSNGDRRGRDRIVDLYLPAANTTNLVSSNPVHGDGHWIQHYAI